jgi:hypothetical protein
MSELDSTATDAREAWLEENEKVEDTNPSEKEIKAADRQKTLESIDFYDRTSRHGKYALGYSYDLINARRAARAEIQKQFYTGDQGTFERYEASRVSSDIQSLHNAEAHERTQLLRYRQEEDAAELIKARKSLSDDITGGIGAAADESMRPIVIAQGTVVSATNAVKIAQSNLDDEEKRAEDARKRGEVVDEKVILARASDLEAANEELTKSVAALESAGLAQDNILNAEFTRAHTRIVEATKAHFERRYKEFLQYGYGESTAYVMAANESSELSKGVIEDLIANGNREAANSILDIMYSERLKKNEDTGKYEEDRSKRGYMGAGTIKQFKDAIKAQRKQEKADALESRKAKLLELAPDVEAMEYRTQTEDVSDAEIRNFCKDLANKGYPEYGNIYAKLTSNRKTRENKGLESEIESFGFKIHNDPNATIEDVKSFCERLEAKGYEKAGSLYSSLKRILDDKKSEARNEKRYSDLEKKDIDEARSVKYASDVMSKLEECRRNLNSIVTEDAGKDGTSKSTGEMYLKAKEGMMWLERAISDGVIKDGAAKTYRDAFSSKLIKYRRDELNKAFRSLGIKFADGKSIKTEAGKEITISTITDGKRDAFEHDDYARLFDVIFTRSSDGGFKLDQGSDDKYGGYVIPIDDGYKTNKNGNKVQADDRRVLLITKEEMQEILNNANDLIDAYHGGSIKDAEGKSSTQLTFTEAFKRAILHVKKNDLWKQRRSEAVRTILDGITSGTIITAEERLRENVVKEADKMTPKEEKK